LTSLKKLDYPVSGFGQSDFSSFRIKPRKKLNLKIQGILRQGKGLKSVNKPRWNKSKKKAKATKIGLSSFGFWSVRFSRNRESPIRV
jgi:hypothetical protein